MERKIPPINKSRHRVTSHTPYSVVCEKKNKTKSIEKYFPFKYKTH